MSLKPSQQPHAIITIEGADGYPLKARFWQCPQPRAMLVMVHGVVSHSLWLAAIAEPLAQKNICTLAVDRRGAGMNTLSRGDAPSEETLIADLEAVMQWAGTFNIPMHIGGFCWGSNYIVSYLHACDTTVPIKSMILIAPSLFPSQFILQRSFVVGESGEPTEEPVMPIDQFTDGPLYESFIKPDPLRLRKVSQRLNQCIQRLSSNIWIKFLRLEIPCLMLLGEKDTVVDNVATQRVFDRLKANPKQSHCLPGNHGIQFDEPGKAVAHISDWINLLIDNISETSPLKKS